MFLVLCGIIGAAVGNFLAVCVDRLPSSNSVIWPPSHCPACGHRLSAADMVPLVSYIVLRGKCRYCASPIPWRLFFIEMLTSAMFVLLGLHYGPGVPLIFALLHLCFLIVIFMIDLEHHLILNRTVYPAMGIALLGALVLSDHPFRGAALGGLIGFAIFFTIVFIYPAGMGMGDARLAAYIGLITGMPAVFIALFLAIILGGIVGVVLLATGVKGRKDPIPFGPFLVIGGLIAMLYGKQLIRWYLGG